MHERVFVCVLVESVFNLQILTCISAYWPIVYPTILQFGEGKIMSVKECRTIWTAGNKPDAYVTKKNICFGGGQDGTVSSCRVSNKEGSY